LWLVGVGVEDNRAQTMALAVVALVVCYLQLYFLL
jgi:hypothetical protein